MRWFIVQSSLEDAVSVAALAQSPSGKRFSHQRRLPGSVLARARLELQRSIENIRPAATFDDLHAEVQNIVGGIPGIGELYVYDTAVRIGVKRQLSPKHVYIHAGVREGARMCGLDPTRTKIPMSDLPNALRTLEPNEVEDILCIYKHQIAGAAMAERANSRCFA